LQHFLSFKQIFLSLHWGYGPSILGPNDDAFLGLGPIHLLLAVFGYVFSLRYVRSNKKYSIFSTFLVFSFLGYAFLSHERSTFIWKNFSFLEIMQFPWRFIFVCGFVASFLGAFIFDNIVRGKAKFIVGGALLFITLIFYFPMFSPKSWFAISDSRKLSGELLQKQLTASIYDYLPKSASRAPDNVAPEGPIVINGGIDKRKANRGSDWYRYNFEILTDSAQIAIPTYDFPVWEVKANGENLKTQAFGEFGLVSVSLEKGTYVLEANLTKSVPRRLGDLVSIASFVSILYLLMYEKVIKKVN
jgi:hypothetical protein